MAKILIADDEPRIRELIQEHLEHEGYQCTQASDGAAALAAVAAGGVDLVILDVMMPFMDGMTCLKEMRLRGLDVPVIILTARGEEYDKLEGLGAGADDYVVKPFSPRELVARVRAVLARTMRRDGQNAGSFAFGGLVIDTASHTVTIDGAAVALTPKEFDLLVFLAAHSEDAQAQRASARQKGEVRFILTDQPSAQRQMVMGQRLAGGGSVIVSTDLERIEQARGVISMQLPVIAAVTLCAGILGAFLFSRWFARPITELSGAARRVAKGDYSARVTPRGHDELAVLAQDFNTMTREVARSNELQRDLLANISHDLRTPLTLIKGYAETVRDLTGADAEKRTAQMDVIIDETDRLSGLVNSVLELSKVSSGAEKLAPVRFDIAQLCEEVAERYEDACTKAGFHLAVQADTPCDIMADPEALSRVVHNFLANAMHHVGADGYLALRVLPKDGGARVEVEDHGAGIPKEDLPYIFDKYYRSRADAGKQGSGLGLSICKAILVRHGFAFGAQSEVGRGSLFWFEAPGAPKQERQDKEQ